MGVGDRIRVRLIMLLHRALSVEARFLLDEMIFWHMHDFRREELKLTKEDDDAGVRWYQPEVYAEYTEDGRPDRAE